MSLECAGFALCAWCDFYVVDFYEFITYFYDLNEQKNHSREADKCDRDREIER